MEQSSASQQLLLLYIMGSLYYISSNVYDVLCSNLFEIILVKLCNVFFLALDAPVDGHFRLQIVALHNYLLKTKYALEYSCIYSGINSAWIVMTFVNVQLSRYRNQNHRRF
jgi:hypothetical protein